MSGELTAVNVGFSYGGSTVLQDVSLSVPAGSQIGLTGPSGSGKTTIARVLAGLLPPSTGYVTCNGAAVRMPGDGRIAMLFQSPRRSCSPRMTLRAVIAEGLRGVRSSGRRKDVDAGVRHFAARVQLTADLLDRYPHEVSDGQLQRACLARSLAAGPDYLICDEATAMLDAATTAAVVRTIGEEVNGRGLGVLALSHDRELLDAWCGTIRAFEGNMASSAGSARV
ncbi:ABC transporter ATP-binding protein [Arthrobacter gengyunqii]|uniref:ATP-binding cassette domain-containing protein n=1 Tax=Arthrobacter gengyunqii TaxID=2886940 RepID=A0ABS8GMM9_9MICC|nr:ATP-binding cassette domain-containing protein [Arthrobacter gengyunqii]MCC3266508.1 ATP-binding cassette domain-containing protein [Arthrobacter gengyunqii]